MNKHLQILAAIALLVAGCKSSTDQETVSENVPSQVNWLDEFPGSLPHLYTDLDSNVYLSWVIESDDTARLVYDQIGTDMNPKPITSGTDWFVNWADYPMISTLHGQNFLAHYLQKSSEGTYSYDIKVTVSNDSGNAWNAPFVLHDDGKEAEHGFVSVTPYMDNFLVVWLDGRNTVMEESHDGHGQGGAMTLRAAILNTNGEKLNEWELDNSVCDCCQTSVAITSSGPAVVYRNRSEDEIRDMYVVRFVDNEWTEPVAVHHDNWNIAGCPVNGPRISAYGNQAVVAWFTAPDEPRVNVVFTKDGGETFSNPVRLDKGSAIGRVDAVMLDDEKAFVTWMEGENIEGALVSASGEVLKRTVIASSSTARSSGFPQITSDGDDIFVAFTDTSSGRVKLGVVKI
ncbi:sialidase family protein [Fulvivirga lutea]|uniref:Exo-alpha-sialidase n=1 Tax=Fulvivirga lutea TaxID=2810512 RepID=A0A975A2P8_9BACT|nr:sialidase family protein [Fulvivirga lutea]QSE98772.1 exo-alpha-sialidase [Fulvivirga lutea]